MHFQNVRRSFFTTISRRRQPRHATRTCFDTTQYPLHILYIYMIYMLVNIGLGHLSWEILPGRSCLGPWARAHGPMQQQLGPRMGPGKISQPRCPRPILINIFIYSYIDSYINPAYIVSYINPYLVSYINPPYLVSNINPNIFSYILLKLLKHNSCSRTSPKINYHINLL